MGDSTRENECVHLLADLFRIGKRDIYKPREQVLFDGTKLEADEFDALMAIMEAWGVIADVGNTPAPYSFIRITGHAVSKAREFDAIEKAEKEPRDIVDEISKTARKNRIIGWTILASIVLAMALTIVNQAIQLFQNLGWIAKP